MDINDFDDAEKLRIILAAIFMHALLSNSTTSKVQYEANAENAVGHADALINKLEEK
jgi:hypothetical protein